MYLIEYNEQGKPYKITVEPQEGLAGLYLDKLPIDLETMIAKNLVIEEIKNKTYIIKGVK